MIVKPNSDPEKFVPICQLGLWDFVRERGNTSVRGRVTLHLSSGVRVDFEGASNNDQRSHTLVLSLLWVWMMGQPPNNIEDMGASEADIDRPHTVRVFVQPKSEIGCLRVSSM